MLTSDTLVGRGLGLIPVSADTTQDELLHGPLESRHREHGATFAPFGGWLMPVSYAGTVGEHTATREAVGLFDEGFFLYYEETDLCRRAVSAGWQVWFVPGSRVVHHEGASTGIRNWKRRRPRYWYESRRRYFVKAFGASGCGPAPAPGCGSTTPTPSTSCARRWSSSRT